MYSVQLVKKPDNVNVYKPDYFPRKFRYKKDAQALKEVVERNGGKVEVVKVK